MTTMTAQGVANAVCRVDPPDRHSLYLEGNNGKGVLLVHGLTGAPAEMMLVARQLHRKGYSVYAPLLAGHGKDARTLRRTNWRDWLDTVIASCERLAATVDQVFAAGICVGGKLALLAADARPDLIQATAIYSPCFGYDGWDVPFYYPVLSSQIGWLCRVPFVARLNFSETPSLGIKDERMRRLVEGMAGDGMLDKFPAKGLFEMHRLGKALMQRLPDIRTPTLILHALEDDLSNPRHARYISDHIGGAHDLIFIEDSYHMLHMDRQNRRVADLTASFFATHSATATGSA